MIRNCKSAQNKVNSRFVTFISLLVVSLAGCANSSPQADLARKVVILESRIVVLEKQKQKSLSDLIDETNEFKNKISKELENFRKSQRFFLSELDQLKDDINLLTNDIEKSQHSTRTVKLKLNRINRKLGDLNIAIDEMQQFFNESVTANSDLLKSQRQEYEQYYQQFKSRKFELARKGLLSFIGKYPSSELADDGLFLVAYMNFLKNDYKKASIRFFELLRQYPNSNRLDESKWWLGVSLERSNDVNGAKDFYKELIRLPANNPLRIKAEFRLEELSDN